MHFWGTAINRKNGRKKRPKGLGRTSRWCHLAPWESPSIPSTDLPTGQCSNLPLTEGQAWWMCSWQFILKTKAQTETITGNLKETHAWGAVWLLNTCALTTCRRTHVSGGSLHGNAAALPRLMHSRTRSWLWHSVVMSLWASYELF